MGTPRENLLAICLTALLLSSCLDQLDSPVGPQTQVFEGTSPSATPPNTLPELILALSHDRPDVRISAAGRLADWGPQAEEAIPALIDNLYYAGAASVSVRQAAADALGEIGPKAQPAVPALSAILIDESTSVQLKRTVIVALGKIDDRSAVPALAAALYIEDPITSGLAAKTIAELTGKEFPGSDEPGFVLDKDGIPFITKAAIGWWEEEGQHQDWLQS